MQLKHWLTLKEEKPSDTLECLLGLSTKVGWNSPEPKKLIQPPVPVLQIRNHLNTEA